MEETLKILDEAQKEYLEYLELYKRYCEETEKFLLRAEEMSKESKSIDLEEEEMTESEIIHEISMLGKEINQHKIAIRDLENEIYKLEDLLKIN
jgi:hypothetical protein